MSRDSKILRVGDDFRPRLINRRRMKHSDHQLHFKFPWQQLRFALESVAEFPLTRAQDCNTYQVEKCWHFFVKRSRLLNSWIKGPTVCKRPEHGLIYYYLLEDDLRYIGRTRQRLFLNRLRQKFSSGIVGYRYDVKRCLLNAAWQGRLRVKTWEVPEQRLDAVEAELISVHAPHRALWNIEHNPFFKTSNFDV